ncbi:hypothetical protein BKA70DRAFT_230617 [Coprinopsis sp. MPI-PUGE-AT-0042]|nr:hypothetical protein BKA70DRAFT_230617 [Coprinopsis sp. MPI-PUGE-AT-0042]
MSRKSERISKLELSRVPEPDSTAAKGEKRKRAAIDAVETAPVVSPAPSAKKAKFNAYSLGNYDVPVELMLKIFEHLDSGTILSLSRTNKWLYKILMSKGSNEIWKSARKRARQLPAPPDGLTEPQWADFVYSQECQVCREVTGLTHEWHARVRACDKCLPSLFAYKVSAGDYPFYQHIPTMNISRGNSTRVGYHVETANQLYDECVQFKEKKKRDAWAKEKEKELKALVPNRKKFAALCEQWEGRMKEGRKRSIIALLQTEGFLNKKERWLEQAKFWKDKHVAVLLSRSSPASAWNEAKEGIIPVAESFRKERIQADKRRFEKGRHEELVSVWSRYRATRPPNDFTIPPGNLFLTRDVQAIFDAATWDQVLKPSDFEKVVEQLPVLSEAWAANAKARLLAMAQKDLTTYLLTDKQEATEAGLDLAVMAYAFECVICNQKMDWKGALVHSCATKHHRADSVNPSMKAFVDDTDHIPWSCQALRLGALRFQHTARVLEFMGHDPKTMLPAQMDSLDEIMQCNTCTSRHDGRLMLDWRLAVFHFHRDSNHLLTKVDETTAAMIRNGMQDQTLRNRYGSGYHYGPYYNSFTNLICAHCNESGRDFSRHVREHMFNKHGLTSPTEADVAEPLDNGPQRREYRYWKFDDSNNLF